MGASAVAEDLGRHLLAATEADPEGPDSAQIRRWACETLAEAGRRAFSLALGVEAQRAFDRAVELAEDEELRAELLEQAGRAGWLAEREMDARKRLGASIEAHQAAGRPRSAARAMAVMADL